MVAFAAWMIPESCESRKSWVALGSLGVNFVSVAVVWFCQAGEKFFAREGWIPWPMGG